MSLNYGNTRRSGRDCRYPDAKEGKLDSLTCVLDTSNPCWYDGCVNNISLWINPSVASNSRNGSYLRFARSDHNRKPQLN